MMPDTSFMDDVRFPVHISRGSVGGPDWLVDVATLASGHEERNTPWSAPLRTYDAKYGVREADEYYEILRLYHVAMGRLRGFRLKDWTDFTSSAPFAAPTDADQEIATGDANETDFQLTKTYTVGGHVFLRTIAKPVGGTILVAVDGESQTEDEDFTVDTASGVLTFASPPGDGLAVTAGYEFDVPVRFDARLDLTMRGTIADIPSIPLVELRL